MSDLSASLSESVDGSDDRLLLLVDKRDVDCNVRVFHSPSTQNRLELRFIFFVWHKIRRINVGKYGDCLPFSVVVSLAFAPYADVNP